MRGTGAVVAALAVVSLGLPGLALAGKKMASISTRCMEGKRVIDAEKERDLCLVTQAPTCAAGRELAIDVEGPADRCQSTDGTPSAVPTCPGKTKLAERAGADACERWERPKCHAGFKLKIQDGEDKCKK
jgi:hypothetical protein